MVRQRIAAEGVANDQPPPDGLLMRAADEEPDAVGKSVRGIVDLRKAADDPSEHLVRESAATCSNKASVEPEVVVDGAARDPGLLGQFADGQLRYASLREDSEGGVVNAGLCGAHRREKLSIRFSVDKLNVSVQYTTT